MESKFSKEQIVNSKHFNPNEKDILNALLSSNKQYTLSEATKVVSDFCGRKINQEEEVKQEEKTVEDVDKEVKESEE